MSARQRGRLPLAALGAALLLSPGAPARPADREPADRALAPTGDSQLDWRARVVRCGGLGAPGLSASADAPVVVRGQTRRAARSAARASCREALAGLAVEAGSPLGVLLSRDGALAAAVDRLVADAVRAGEVRYFSDGGAGVAVSVPLDGALSERVLAAAAGPAGPAAAAARAGGPSGVLVDATGLAAAPALAPRLLDPSGVPLSGAARLAATARGRGGAAFAASAQEARARHADRLGPAPRLVRPARARGGDLVLAAEDAAALRDTPALAEGRVVIVLGARR